jgi:glycosyltransferase involved in cell wall biosynthesis
MKYLALIPCHNEELSIGLTITEIRSVIPDIEIWVIDNGSTDNTGVLAKELGARVIKCPTLGKGYAIRLAFSKVGSRFDAIFMVDGDHTYSIKNLNLAVDAIVHEGFDMVVGTRMQEEFSSSTRGKHYRRGHNKGNIVLTKMFKALFGLEIKDTLSGWRCFSPGFVRSFPGGASGFELETELNAHIFLIKGAFKSLDVGYRGRVEGTTSKLHTVKDGAKILRRLLFLFRTERPLIAYTALGIPWLILSLILIRNVLENYFRLGLIPNFPSLIAGVGSFIASVLLWTTGMLLANQRITRASIARHQYAEKCDCDGKP